jgi:hypothetical protein
VALAVFNNPQRMMLQLWANGVEVARGSDFTFPNLVTSVVMNINVTEIARYTAGTILDIRAYNNGGNTISSAGADEANRFAVAKIA